jgi:serine/threonine-protein kinase
MFFEEARIGSRLHHGSIVPILDYGLIDGSEFMAMEYVEGLDALRAVSGLTTDVVPMPEGIALHITAEIAHALAYIHDLRDDDNRSLAIVHRDVSPPNILLSWNGDVKLSDFGIALSREVDGQGQYDTDDTDDDRASALGGIQGKLHYMAPEQARGEAVGAAADIYALGATLDALLGGGPNAPVTSEDSGNAREAAALGRGLSLPVCALIRSCLARDPRFRPSAADVAARAGVLASRMLGTDGRGALRAWLEPLRARVGRLGALDDLMGLCLVPVAGEGARTFTVSRVRKTPAPGGHRAVEPARRPVFAAVMLTIAIWALAFAWRTVRHSQAQTAEAVQTLQALEYGARADHRPFAGAPAGVARGALPASGAPASPASVEPAAAAADKRGWLRVGGATLVGRRVEADGSFAGFAPVELSLPVGPHVILVTSDAGRVMVRKRFRLGEAQTRLTPLRIIR